MRVTKTTYIEQSVVRWCDLKAVWSTVLYDEGLRICVACGRVVDGPPEWEHCPATWGTIPA